MSEDIRVIAFYLPQFHPIPENDGWWGPGFTEWTNVTRAVPVYRGHDQPRRPGELGYYDLRVREVRHRQAELARNYGIHGFCYYHYWFSGRRLLERPLDLMLADRDLDFPFCLCWANESWSRRWDGSERDILIEQGYGSDDPPRFIRDVAHILRDSRYITVDGSPMLLVYRPAVIPQVREVLRAWRATAEELGLPGLHVCGVQSNSYATGLDDGFDAMVEFPPHSIVLSPVTEKIPDLVAGFSGQVFSYRDAVRYCTRLGAGIGLPVYRGLMSGWDNTARRGRDSHIFDEATPELYEVWLRRLLDDTRRNHDGDRRLVFVNAWNEWAEGAYLEPDETHGYGYLEATARAVFGVPDPSALLATLRHITEGNAEALRALDELEHAVRINQQIIGLIHARGLLADGPSRDGFRGTFHPLGRSGITLPGKHVADGVVGFLDALGTPNYHNGVTLHRPYDVLLQGWIASRHIKADANTPILFRLTGLVSGDQYVAQVLSRIRRDDVVSHLKAQHAYRRFPDECSLYSGYRAYLNISAVKPGSYKLDAIVSTADGQGGATLDLHSSITVL